MYQSLSFHLKTNRGNVAKQHTVWLLRHDSPCRVRNPNKSLATVFKVIRVVEELCISSGFASRMRERA